MKVGRNERLQIDGSIGIRNLEKQNVSRIRGLIQNAVEHGTEQYEAEGIQESDAGEQQNRRNEVPEVRNPIAEQPFQLLHEVLPLIGSDHRCRHTPRRAKNSPKRRSSKRAKVKASFYCTCCPTPAG